MARLILCTDAKRSEEIRWARGFINLHGGGFIQGKEKSSFFPQSSRSTAPLCGTSLRNMEAFGLITESLLVYLRRTWNATPVYMYVCIICSLYYTRASKQNPGTRTQSNGTVWILSVTGAELENFNFRKITTTRNYKNDFGKCSTYRRCQKFWHFDILTNILF